MQILASSKNFTDINRSRTHTELLKNYKYLAYEAYKWEKPSELILLLNSMSTDEKVYFILDDKTIESQLDLNKYEKVVMPNNKDMQSVDWKERTYYKTKS